MTQPEAVAQSIWDTFTPEAQACLAVVIGRLEQRIADLETWPNQNSRICKKLRKVESAFWTFVRMHGFEPTNNRAERALCHAVIWRRPEAGPTAGPGADSWSGS